MKANIKYQSSVHGTQPLTNQSTKGHRKGTKWDTERDHGLVEEWGGGGDVYKALLISE
jgi:hypothetical protein